MTFSASALIGFFLGFAFGLGCALAVLYSIYMGGYRAAIRDALEPTASARYLVARAYVDRSRSKNTVPRNN